VKEKKRKRTSFLGPVLLICLGIILLLNTTGILEWSIWWTILSLWPVFIIALGLELLIGWRSAWASLLVALMVVAIAAGALWASQSSIAGSSLDSQKIKQPLGEADQAEVSIDPVMGVLRIDALPESANLVEGEIRLGRNEEVREQFSLQGGKAIYTLGSSGESWAPLPPVWNSQRIWDLGLSPGATLQLRPGLAFGAKELDLTGLTLDELHSSMAVGHTKVILPGSGRAEAQITQALGVVEVIIPKETAVRLRAGTALVPRFLPGDFQKQENDVYASPGYASAQNRVDLDISLAIGLLTIRYAE
jgi:hypothetical protein